jgi:signal transduction histidine kinase
MPIRPQDVVWVLLFGVLAVFGPERHPAAITLLTMLAMFQIVESKMAWFATSRGNLASIFIKLGLAYVLIGYTDGIASSYYFVLLLPVVSAATTLGTRGTIGFIVGACGAYLSFLLFIDWSRQTIPPDQVKELLVRVALLPVIGLLTHQLAGATRERARSYQMVAEQLAAANQSLREAEAAMRRADRLAALGQLTAGLAHELRNPMSTIRSSAEMLQRTLPAEDDVARELAGYISSEVDRTNSLITRFLEFARPMRLRLSPADLGAVIDRAIAQVERVQGDCNVAVYKNYSPDIRPVLMDGELIERVVYNLVLNAIQASPAEGAVTVKTRPVDGEVELSIIDRGPGIDPKQVENIFNPFFTTKPDGVGLGLAIVSKIVDEHGGKILVESQPGEGSVFRVYLPVKPRQE